MKNINLHSADVPKGKLEQRSLIIQEFLQEYERSIHQYKSKSEFVKYYIERNSNDQSKSPLVKEYENILKNEEAIRANRRKRKKRKVDVKKMIVKKEKRKRLFCMDIHL